MHCETRSHHCDSEYDDEGDRTEADDDDGDGPVGQGALLLLGAVGRGGLVLEH